MNILLVDDNSLLLETFQLQLEDMGHRVMTACNGAEALEIIQTERGLDLVISDNDMPIMTGSELVNHLNQQDISHPPLIIWSGYIEKVVPEVRKKIFGFLSKPVDRRLLEKHIARIGYMKYSKILIEV